MKKTTTFIFLLFTFTWFVSEGIVFAHADENKLGIKIWDDKTGGVGIAVKNEDKLGLNFYIGLRPLVSEDFVRHKSPKIKENKSFRWISPIFPDTAQWYYGYDIGGEVPLVPSGKVERIVDSISQIYSVTAERAEVEAWTFAALGIRNMSLNRGDYYKIHFVAQDQNGKVYVCDKTAEGRMFVYAKFPEDFGWIYLNYSGRIDVTAYIDDIAVKSMVVNYSKNRTVIYQ